ncbi:MAG TPA: glycosyltransferase [Pyrinomonadaceae bacterium]|nr:glycosyltransferase [Pyrinomonadaceae bacterium]
MRITLVIGSLNTGGAERVCVNLANAWAEHGWPVTILTVSQRSRPSPYTIDPRVKRRDIGKPRLARAVELNHDSVAPVVRGLQRDGCLALIGEMGLITMLRYGILTTAPDVVIPIIDMTNVRVIAAMYGTGVPVIACEQTDSARVSLGKWQGVRKALYRRAHAVVAPQPSIADWLAQQGARAWAIPNPLIAPPPMRIQRNGQRRRLVTLSRLSQEKRPELLVRAFARVAHDFPEWDLEVHGDGPLRSQLIRCISELAPGRIHLHGFVDAPYTILDGADLFVSTSWVEGFGNAIWEALACGVPVVAMDAGAPVRSLLRDGIDGLIVTTNSTPALASALASLMGDGAARHALAARAREVLTRFPIESSLAKWDALLDDVVEQTQGWPAV